MAGTAALGLSRELRTQPIRNRPRTSRWGQVEHKPAAMSPASSRPPRQAHSPRATSCRNKFLIRDRGSNFTSSFDAVFLPGRRHQDPAHRRPGAADERDRRAPCRYPAPGAPEPHADPRRAPPALRPGRIPGALQHGQAAPGHRPARPRQRTRRWPPHRCRPRPRTDPPQTRPQRPDQRIHARRLTPRRLAGHQADPIFERDRIGGHPLGRRFERPSTTGTAAAHAARARPW